MDKKITNQNAEIISEFEAEKQAVLNDQLDDAEISKINIPLPYVITNNNGIKKIGKKSVETICPRPIIIKDKIKNLDDKTYKLTLAYLDSRHKWHTIPAQDRGIILNKNKIVDLISYGLPINTGNAAKTVDYLLSLDLENEYQTPISYSVNRCGWYTYKDNQYFIDPRIKNTVQAEGQNINITVSDNDQMAKDLQTAGSFDKWKEAYNLAANSTVARFNVAAAMASALLKPLKERNFVCYTYGKTRGGKSTALFLAASAVGKSDLVRVFDGTTTALNSAAVETNHYPLFVDEKQSADKKLKNSFIIWIYNDANGVERARARRDGTVKPVRTWQHITICNGETMLLDNNATGGAHTRILQIAAPDVILDAETSAKIREIIADNYGHAYPFFIEALQKISPDKLRAEYQEKIHLVDLMAEEKKIDIIEDYKRYLAIVLLADQILNNAMDNFKNDIGTLDYEKILEMLPTTDITDDSAREAQAVTDFIGQYGQHFDNEYNKDALKCDCYGKWKGDYLYIIAGVLNQHLEDKGFTPSKVAADLVKSGYFITSGKIDADRKTRATVPFRLNGKLQRCYKVKKDPDNDNAED